MGGRRKILSQPISRVLSRTIIHLGRVSPHGSSNLPGDSAGRIIAPLFGLAPDGVFPADAVTSVRGALLPHLFTLTGPAPKRGAWAVCFLWHFPWACTPQALPGDLPYGARTFLHAHKGHSDGLANSRRTVWATACRCKPKPLSRRFSGVYKTKVFWTVQR